MFWLDQMVKDISMVFDSNEFAQQQLAQMSSGATLTQMSDGIADLYYQAIDAALSGGSQEMRNLGSRLIGEICSNLGVDVFDDLATEWVHE